MPGAKRLAARKWRSEARARPDLAPTLRKLGQRVRELRTQRGLTQEELARHAQLGPKHVQTIEAGETNVTVSTLLGLADALNCSLADLFT